MPEMLLVLIVAGISAFIGYLAGLRRENPVGGAILGFFLGPVGWAVAYWIFDCRPKCDQCCERVDPNATVCIHCGAHPVRTEPGN